MLSVVKFENTSSAQHVAYSNHVLVWSIRYSSPFVYTSHSFSSTSHNATYNWICILYLHLYLYLYPHQISRWVDFYATHGIVYIPTLRALFAMVLYLVLIINIESRFTMMKTDTADTKLL